MPGKNLPAHGSIISSGGLVPPQQQLQLCEPQDIATLPDEAKQLLFKYDCDCEPLFENQLGAQDARDNLASLWGIQLSATSPTSSSRQSLPTTPLSDLALQQRLKAQARHFSQHSVEIKFLGYLELERQAKKHPILQCFQRQTLNHPKTPVPESDGEDKTITPNNLETPKVCRAPKKRKSEFSLSVLFED